jgi:hypothetical protein
MKKTISNEINRKLNIDYDPSEIIKDENEELPIKDWIQKYRNVIPSKDIFWIFCRKEFLSEKDLVLFAVWCAREALKLISNPDKRSVEACNVAEKYINGEATQEELLVAYDNANNAAYIADSDVSRYAADAAFYAARSALIVANAANSADISDANVYLAVNSAAHVIYLANFADSDTVPYDADNTACASQIDKLLSYF